MDADAKMLLKLIPAGLIVSALLFWTGCSALKYHQGRSAASLSGTAGSTNRYESSVAAEAQKTAHTFLAQNIKIITVNSIVTLRGVVQKSAEKARIEALAEQIPVVKKVNDQLEVKEGAHP
jgi:osmotically-inducible protein OsmY